MIEIAEQYQKLGIFTMFVDKKRIKEIEKRISKLKNLEKELVEIDRYAIPITKLTIIKYLCRDSFAMVKFAYFISSKVIDRIKYVDNDILLKTPITESLLLMKIIIINFTRTSTLVIDKENKKKLEIFNKEIREFQNKIESKKWTDIRIIKNWDIFIIEEALSCFIYFDFPEMGYRLAKSYTEKYCAKFGSGLIPESLEYLKEINSFWIDYSNELKWTNNIVNKIK